MKAREAPILDIVRLAGVEPQKKGREWLALCPFHEDKSPSLSINVEKNVWICWTGCGGGSPVDFIMRIHGLDFPAACQWIEAKLDIKRELRPVIKTTSQLQYEREKAIEQEIEETFNLCFAARQALKAELRLRGDDPPEQMIFDLGLFETISAEIASASPERVAIGLGLYRRWRQCRHSLQAS